MNHAGYIPSFNVEPYLQVAQMLVDADDPKRAIELLTNFLPAFYRDHTPIEIINAVNKITSSLMTPTSYSDCKDDSVFCESPDRAKLLIDQTLRGQLMLKSVQEYNEKGIAPHLIEIGPGEYWLSQGLKAHNCKFTYQDIAVNEYTKEKSKFIERTPWDKEAPVIYVAQEIIEHMSDPHDLAIELYRVMHGKQPNQIHVSTPLYTFDGKPKPIATLERNGLPHLRAYTPQEFLSEVMRVFGAAYKWDFSVSPIMSLVGTLK